MAGNESGEHIVCHDYMAALERTINEMDVLRAIYGEDGDNNNHGSGSSSSFEIVSPGPDEMNRMRRFLGLCIEDGDEDDDFEHHEDKCDEGGNMEDQPQPFPDIQIQLRIPIQNIEENGSDDDRIVATLRCRLPLGYPEYFPALVTSLRLVPARNRSLTEEIARSLNETSATSLQGTESIMDLVEETRELLLSDRFAADSSKGSDQVHDVKAEDQHRNRGCRMWIWVHHITSTDRRKSILEEARERDLTGILKHGYPGVVLVEGSHAACESFVGWIKGNKSRPGGFGRNWGHHVRGEIEFPLSGSPEEDSVVTKTVAMTTFEEMEELSAMAKSCKELGLEDEFKEFVMQHKK
ncbi:unnamed protein product [Pseudo-nitzschia multistriata]|uniref:RWD domain-containing protein n=1 Tax=Pseudo-nitzschia multistriata TaxID=183589 RepID=A0A448ZLM4_9STRA|nr:unnamed protein product [Pseudo-nitzschia multistriata]